jgi:hypothetical protein
VSLLSFINHRRVRWIPRSLYDSKALKHEHCRVRTSSIGTDRGNDGWIYELTGSIIIIDIKIASHWTIILKSNLFRASVNLRAQPRRSSLILDLVRACYLAGGKATFAYRQAAVIFRKIFNDS